MLVSSVARLQPYTRPPGGGFDLLQFYLCLIRFSFFERCAIFTASAIYKCFPTVNASKNHSIIIVKILPTGKLNFLISTFSIVFINFSSLFCCAVCHHQHRVTIPRWTLQIGAFRLIKLFQMLRSLQMIRMV